MRRLQLIELEDQPWCPALLRDAAQFSDYHWEIGQERVPGMLSALTYLLGYPASA